MKKIFLLVVAIAFANLAIGQVPTLTWAKQLGGSSNTYGNSMVADATGNVYTVGDFNVVADFDPGPGVFNLTSNGNSDVFICKLDPSGNLLWAKGVGGTGVDQGMSIAVDPSGNVYVSGAFFSTVDFDPGAGVFNLTSAGSTDAFVLKLDASGNFVWAKRWGSTQLERAEGIALDASNNIYITGRFLLTVDFDPGVGVFNITSFGGTTIDAYVSKLDASGNFVWAKQLGGSDPSGDVGNAISVDGSGNVYSAGLFYGTADFDPGVGVSNLTSFGGQDIYISKLDASGNFVWAKQLGGSMSDVVPFNCLMTDAIGNVYTTGPFQGTADFDPGVGTFTIASFGSSDAFVSKLDASGNFVWAKQLGGTGGDSPIGIAVDQNGSVYSSGRFTGSGDFDPGAGVYTLTASVADAYISKLSSAGNFIFASQLVSNNGSTQTDLCVNSNLDLFIIGYSQNAVDYDLGVGTFTLNSGAAANAHVVRYCQNPEQPTTINGLANVCSGSSTTYSTITAGATSYTWSLPGGWSGSSSTNTISATPGTTGIFTVTANNACGASPQQTLNVTVNPQPTISVNSGSICSGQSFTMVPSGANTYTIQGGSAVVSPTTTTSYTVVGTSIAGCVSSSPATSNLTVSPLPTISASTNNTLICVGQSATLTASGASTYTFNPGGAGASIVVSPTVTSNYTITGTSAQGCNNSSVLTQSVSTCAGLSSVALEKEEINVYPNPFHNKITVVSNGIKQSVQVFNALGSLIYKAEIENEKIEIDLEKESSGIYFIKIGTGIKKIIKE